MKFTMGDIKRELESRHNRPEVAQDQISKQIQVTTRWLHDKGIQPRNMDIFNCMIKYISETKLECRQKGLFLFGSVGTGKSFAAKVISSCFKIQFYTCRDLEKIFENSPEHFWEVIRERKEIIIDDLGTEDERNDYGTKFELMERALDERHKMFESMNIRTIITTNLSGKAIAARYSERIYSRLHQMCECVNATGEDLRRK